MPHVQMPDGAIVDMPDKLDPETAARFRKLVESKTRQPTYGKASAGGPPVSGETWQHDPQPEMSIAERAGRAASIYGARPALNAILGVPEMVAGGLSGIANKVVNPLVERVTGVQQQPSVAPNFTEGAMRAIGLPTPETPEEKSMATGQDLGLLAGTVGSAALPSLQRLIAPAIESIAPSIRPVTEAASKIAKPITSLPEKAKTAFIESAQDLPASLPRERLQAALELEKRGAPVTGRQVMEGQKARVPSAGKADKQTEAVHQAYRESVGEPAGKSFGKEDLDRSFERIGKGYDTVLEGRSFAVPRDTFENLNSMSKELQSLRDSAGKSAVPSKLMERLSALTKIYNDASAKGLKNIQVKIAGDDYNKLRSLLGKEARATADDEVASRLYSMQRELDKAAEAGMPEIADDLRTLRRQYRNASVLDEASVGSESGLIPPQRVRQLLERRYGSDAHSMDDPLVRMANASRSLNIGHPGASAGANLPAMQKPTLKMILDAMREPAINAQAWRYKLGERARSADEAAKAIADQSAETGTSLTAK